MAVAIATLASPNSSVFIARLAPLQTVLRDWPVLPPSERVLYLGENEPGGAGVGVALKECGDSLPAVLELAVWFVAGFFVDHFDYCGIVAW